MISKGAAPPCSMRLAMTGSELSGRSCSGGTAASASGPGACATASTSCGACPLLGTATITNSRRMGARPAAPILVAKDRLLASKAEQLGQRVQT